MPKQVIRSLRGAALPCHWQNQRCLPWLIQTPGMPWKTAPVIDGEVVAAYGLILPQAVLEAPRLGCLNVHASLLPRWRGAAPVERAILAGDRETGVTIMQMDEGLDTGPMLLQQPVPILPDTTAGQLTETLAELGVRLMLQALDGVAAGTLAPRPQPEEGVTYAPKIDREEARLDWRQPADRLERRVRAFAPMPGAWFSGGGEPRQHRRREIRRPHEHKIERSGHRAVLKSPTSPQPSPPPKGGEGASATIPKPLSALKGGEGGAHAGGVGG